MADYADRAPGILCYMNMCSSEYMNILYTGLTGRLVMTAALMVYAAALWTGHKIWIFMCRRWKNAVFLVWCNITLCGIIACFSGRLVPSA